MDLGVHGASSISHFEEWMLLYDESIYLNQSNKMYPILWMLNVCGKRMRINTPTYLHVNG